MSAADFVIPPLAQMFLSGIWTETLIYGINIVLFLACMHVLTTRRQNAHFILVLSTCLMFAGATAHIGLSFTNLRQAFTDPALLAAPHGPDLYFANVSAPIFTAKSVVYAIVVFLQDLLLIWRLYVVWGSNWKIAVLPLIVEFAHTASSLTAVALIAKPGSNIFDPSVQAWGKGAWSMDIIVNTCVTLAIAGRLWYMERKLASVASRTHSYRTAMYTIVESGGIFALSTLTLFVFDLLGREEALVGIDPIVQLAVLTPLLLIVRVGLGLTHGDSRPTNIQTTVTTDRWNTNSRGIHVDVARSTMDDRTTAYSMTRIRDGKESQLSLKDDAYAV